MIVHGMTSLTKKLAAVLVATSINTVHGQNSCFTDGRCVSGEFRPSFIDCGLTNSDIRDLNSCIDVIGRSSIVKIDVRSNGFTTIHSSLLQGMASLENFSVVGNDISRIEEGALQNVASTLKVLDLTDNELEDISSNLFAGMDGLITLLMGFNPLTSLPAGAFVDLTNLQHLLLENTQLTSLTADAFVGLANVVTLSLNSNQLTSLPADVFVNLPKLINLDLVANTGLQCIPATTATKVSISSRPGVCECPSVTTCSGGICTPGSRGFTCSDTTACPPGVDVCDDPHMQGLRGQNIDWSGVDGGWYCLVTDDDANLRVNVRLTAPLPEDFPDRQLITGVSVVSEGHSLTIEVENPYSVDTDGCPPEFSPCLANGGLRALVDGEEVDGLLVPSRHETVADGIAVSASNLPVECRQFGGDTIWARMHDEMLQGTRQLNVQESFEDWILSFDHMAAVDWCTQYIAQHSLAQVQSNHAIFKIVTSSVTVRLNVGTNFQGNGELDWDGRVLPDLEFWQMDVGLNGLSIESPSLSGILGETARPVLDKNGDQVMEGYDAFRGTVADYRVSGALGTDFALLNKT